MLTKQEALREEVPGQRAGAEGAQVHCPATWLAVSGLMVMAQLPGRLCSIILTQGPSLWHTHCSANMDASEEDSGRW